MAVPWRGTRSLSEGAIALFSLKHRKLSAAAQAFRSLVQRGLQSARFRAQIKVDSKDPELVPAVNPSGSRRADPAARVSRCRTG